MDVEEDGDEFEVVGGAEEAEADAGPAGELPPDPMFESWNLLVVVSQHPCVGRLASQQ